MLDYRVVTPGERLCMFLYANMIVSEVWQRLEHHLLVTTRASEFREFFQQALAINLTGRLVLIGKFVTTMVDATESGFLAYLDPYIYRHNLSHLNKRGMLARAVKDSVIASNHAIPRSLLQKMRQWAQREHPHCYLCGCQLNFLNDTLPYWCTIDHVWPQFYGGDSVEENLLPACKSCNSQKKKEYPAWGSCDIQSLILGIKPTQNAINSVVGRHRYALHNRVAQLVANRRRISLKEAYLLIGHWRSDVSPIDETDVGHFFNLTNHEPENLSLEHVFL